MKEKKFPKLIAIVGGSGAGKTRLAERLQCTFGPRVARLSQDDFYRDLGQLAPSHRAKINFDHPRAIDWRSFTAVLRDCRAGRVTGVPQYNFDTHTRLPDKRTLIPAPLVLVEGLWLLWPPQLRDLFDLKIYLDCPAPVRLERRLARDAAERGRTPDSIRRQFSSQVAPMHERFVAPQAGWADIILKQPPGEPDLRELMATLRGVMAETGVPETMAAAGEELCLQTTR
jgi:uridine kinase